MGIHDRDYIREQRPGGGMMGGGGAGGLGGIRALSVNTWLILICVAIFIIDGFLPPQLESSGRYLIPQDMPIEEVQYELAREYATSQPPVSQVRRGMMYVPMVDPNPQPMEQVPREHLSPTDRLLGVTPEELRGRQIVMLHDRGTSRPPVSGARRGMYYVPIVDARDRDVIGWQENLVVFGWVEHFVMTPLRRALFFSTQRGFLNLEVWRLIGFQFLHADMMHLLFNMIGLFFFGPMIERHLGSKRYLAFYLLCGICGALLYTFLNLLGYIAQLMGMTATIPGLLFNMPTTPLIGASAGVFGVLMAGAYIAPKATVLLFFILPMQLRTLAYALVAAALFLLITGGRNAGGEAGHLGGAMAGWYLIRNPRHLHGFFDFLGQFDPTSRHYRGPGSGGARDPASRKEIDRILDKINRDGLHSLTDAEKRKLRDASQRDQ